MKGKIFIAISLVLTFVCIFGVNAFANESDTANLTTSVEDSTGEYAQNEEQASDTTDIVEDNSSTADQDASEQIKSPVENVFEILFDEVTKYFSEILCFLTFISSIVIAFAYKKGLIPIVESGLNTINRVVTKIKEDNEENGQANKDNYDLLSNRVDEYEAIITALNDKVHNLILALTPLGEELKNNELIEQLIVSQTKMLYEVFMASSLPVYQKEKVEAHFKKMMEDMQGEK